MTRDETTGNEPARTRNAAPAAKAVRGMGFTMRNAAFVLLVPALLLAACNNRTKHPLAAAPQPVRVAVASDVMWPESVTVPATVSATDVAVLASRAGGWVTEVNAEAGARVRQGEILLSVGLPAAASRVAEAEARLKAAAASLEEAAANERRYSALLRTHATSAREYDAVERTFISAKAEVAAARSALAAAQSDLGYAEIRAPFAGTVVEKNVFRGAFAAPGAPLLTLAGLTPEIRAYVGPAIYQALSKGETATVDINGNLQPAIITRLVDAADPETRTHLVELHLREAVSAPFGTYAEVRFPLGSSRQLAVPETALTERAGLGGVFIVDTSRHAHFRLVRAGAHNDGQVVIAAGLTPGETVVLAPPAALINDTLVQPQGRLSAALPPAGLRD